MKSFGTVIRIGLSCRGAYGNYRSLCEQRMMLQDLLARCCTNIIGCCAENTRVKLKTRALA